MKYKLSKRFVLDADAIISRFLSSDVNHKKTLAITDRLSLLEADILCPITAITEAVTFVQRVYSNKQMALDILESYYSSDVIYYVDDTICETAFEQFFKQTKSKKNTYYDCIIAAVAQKEEAIIFSYDKFYTSLGFTLAEELLKK